MKRHLLLLVIVTLAGPSLAEDSPMPVLGDHRFVPATRIEDAFLNGYVQTSVAVGSATNTNTPEFVLPDSTVVQIAPASQLFFGLAFRYQHRMKDWLAVNATISAAGRMGSNTRSLLSDGVTGTVGYALGWKVRAVETSSFLMSGSFSLTNTALSLINVLDWADDIFEGRQSDLVRSRGFLRGRFGLQLVQQPGFLLREVAITPIIRPSALGAHLVQLSLQVGQSIAQLAADRVDLAGLLVGDLQIVVQDLERCLE